MNIPVSDRAIRPVKSIKSRANVPMFKMLLGLGLGRDENNILELDTWDPDEQGWKGLCHVPESAVTGELREVVAWRSWIEFGVEVVWSLTLDSDIHLKSEEGSPGSVPGLDWTLTAGMDGYTAVRYYLIECRMREQQ